MQDEMIINKTRTTKEENHENFMLARNNIKKIKSSCQPNHH